MRLVKFKERIGKEKIHSKKLVFLVFFANDTQRTKC